MAISSANLNSSPSGASAQSTIMSSISTRNTNFSVNLTQKIDANGPGAATLAKTANAGLSAAKQDISGLRAGMVADIQTAKGEIMAATKAAGHDAGDVFPQSTTPNSVAELGLSAATSAAGKGSMATAVSKAFDAASAVETISADRSKSPAEAKAEIADVLCSANSPSLTETFGHVAQADAAPEMQPTKVDWKSFLEEHGNEGMETIMAFDPDGYNPDVWPELAAVDEALTGIDQKMAEFDNTQAYAEQNMFAAAAVGTMGMDALTAQAANLNVPAGSVDHLGTSAGIVKAMGANVDATQAAFDQEAAAQAAANAAKFNDAAPNVMAS